MNIGKACAIIENLDTQDYSTDEKVTAIHIVVNMETRNGIDCLSPLGHFTLTWDKILKSIESDNAYFTDEHDNKITL